MNLLNLLNLLKRLKRLPAVDVVSLNAHSAVTRSPLLLFRTSFRALLFRSARIWKASFPLAILVAVCCGVIAATGIAQDEPAGKAPAATTPNTAANATKPGYLISVASDSTGTIYVADRDLPGIWKISDGKWSLFFQGSKKFRTPLNAIRCVAVDSAGRLYAGDSSTRDVYRFDTGNTPTPLTKGANAGIGIPMSIGFLPNGDLIVADLEIHSLVRVPAAGGEATLFARAESPRGVAVDTTGNVWVACNNPRGKQLLRFDADGKETVIVADRKFDFPHTVAVDASGNAFVVDGYGKTIWKVDSTGAISPFVTAGPLKNPVSVVLAGERFLLADPRAPGLFEISLTGEITPLPFVPAE